MTDVIEVIVNEPPRVIEVLVPGRPGPQGPQGEQGPPGPALTPTEQSFTVVGGTIGGTQPTFDGAPLFAGSYIRVGPVVFFRINVDFTNITDFGTGQYFVELPLASEYGLQLRGGCLHRVSNGRQYPISGHADPGSNVLTLWTSNNQVEDVAFTSTTPYALTTADSFHIGGTYFTSAS